MCFQLADFGCSTSEEVKEEPGVMFQALKRRPFLLFILLCVFFSALQTTIAFEASSHLGKKLTVPAESSYLKFLDFAESRAGRAGLHTLSFSVRVCQEKLHTSVKMTLSLENGLLSFKYSLTQNMDKVAQ